MTTDTTGTTYTLEVRAWLLKQTFTITPTELVRTWNNQQESAEGEERFPLAQLSPILTRQAQFAPYSKGESRKAALFYGAALCVYFSTFQAQIPLLALFLVLIGTPSLLNAIGQFRQYSWTIVQKRDGTRAVSMLHGRNQDAERDAFERRLVAAITATTE